MLDNLETSNSATKEAAAAGLAGPGGGGKGTSAGGEVCTFAGSK